MSTLHRPAAPPIGDRFRAFAPRCQGHTHAFENDPVTGITSLELPSAPEGAPSLPQSLGGDLLDHGALAQITSPDRLQPTHTLAPGRHLVMTAPRHDPCWTRGGGHHE